MDPYDEQKLIQAIRGGDKQAFKELVNPLIARAFQTALGILRSSHLAEEAVQNSLIELYKSIMAGKEIYHVRGWFSRLIANRSLDLIRKETRHNGGLDIDNLVVEDSTNSPIEELLKKEQHEQILHALMSLDVQLRTVVVLFYFQDMKIEEIASLLEVKAGTVKTRLYRARLSLSTLLPSPQLNGKVVRL
jgi:RNA polymerase sigma factor (sigma-70 family)